MLGLRSPRRFQFTRRTGGGTPRVHFQRLRANTREHGRTALVRLLVLLGVVLFLLRWLAR